MSIPAETCQNNYKLIRILRPPIKHHGIQYGHLFFLLKNQ